MDNSYGSIEMNPEGDLTDEEFDNEMLQDPIVTIDRKRTVGGSFVASTVLGLVVLAGTVTLFGAKAFRDFDHLMLLFFGVTLACLCAMIAVWIRARWICVAVLDESGVIASTLERKYDLTWGELIGARTYTKVIKDSNKVQARVLLLLEDSRCLEAPVDTVQLNPLFRVAFSAEFKANSEGQRLGSTKGLAMVVLGISAMILGSWWAGLAIAQWNNGVLLQGNFKAILIKVASATVVPIGGLGCMIWGLYHTIARPILYKPGYLSGNK